MITEKNFEYIQKELEDSFAYTLHDKLIFISGLLSEDKELEPILNFVNYLLYTEKPEINFNPSLDFSASPISLHSDSLCKSCKKVHSYSNVELNCESCPNKPFKLPETLNA